MKDFYFKFSGDDTYKAVRNFIENGLGLNKQDIINQITNEALLYAEKAIQESYMPKRIDDLIEEKISKAMMGKFGWDYNDSLKKYIEKRIDAEVSNQVSKIIKDNFVFKVEEKESK